MVEEEEDEEEEAEDWREEEEEAPRPLKPMLPLRSRRGVVLAEEEAEDKW